MRLRNHQARNGSVERGIYAASPFCSRRRLVRFRAFYFT